MCLALFTDFKKITCESDIKLFVKKYATKTSSVSAYADRPLQFSSIVITIPNPYVAVIFYYIDVSFIP